MRRRQQLERDLPRAVIKPILDSLRRDERGVTIVVVLAIMLVLLTLSSVVLASALNLHDSSTRNRNEVAAFAAAQAGLDIATWRLNQEYSNLSDTQCMTVSSNVFSYTTPTVGNFCAPIDSGSVSPALARGSSYKYWDSAVETSGTCGSMTVTYSASDRQRCLVAVGTAGGVTRRLVELLAAVKGNNSIANNGIEALSGVSITENSKGSVAGCPSSTCGANGLSTAQIAVNPPNTFNISGCSPTPSILYAPGSGNNSTDTTNDSTCTPGITNLSPGRTSNWPTLTSSLLDPWFNGTQEGTGDTSLAANNDDNLLAGMGFSFNTTTRVLQDNPSSAIALSGSNTRANSGGQYWINVCDISFSHAGTTITLTNGAVLNLLVDSSSRTVSGSPACSAAYDPSVTVTGGNQGWNYSATSTSECNYPPGTPGDATALRIFAYGTGTHELQFSNAQGFAGLLMAPGWNIKLTGGGGCRSVVWYGAINTNGYLDATNGIDFHAVDESGVGTSGSQTTVYARNQPQGWAECASSYSSSSPDASC